MEYVNSASLALIITARMKSVWIFNYNLTLTKHFIFIISVLSKLYI